MKKVIKIEGLDCAHCAANIENRILKLDGVLNAKVNFLTEKMIVEASDDAFYALQEEIIKICKDVEPDCSVEF